MFAWLARKIAFRERSHGASYIDVNAIQPGDWIWREKRWCRVSENLHGATIKTEGGPSFYLKRELTDDFKHLVPDPGKAAVFSVVTSICSAITSVIAVVISLVALCRH